MRWSIPVIGSVLAVVGHLTSWWGIAIIAVLVVAHFLTSLAGGSESYTGAPTGEPDVYQFAAFLIITLPMVVGLYVGNAISDALGAAIGSVALGLIGTAVWSVLVAKSEVGFSRRRPLRQWPPDRLAEHVLLARAMSWEGEEGEASVRAGLLLHQDPDLLPRSSVEGEGDFFEYIVLDYMADVHNIVAHQTGTVEDMLNGVHGFASEAEGRTFIRDNYPEPDRRMPRYPESSRPRSST